MYLDVGHSNIGLKGTVQQSFRQSALRELNLAGNDIGAQSAYQ